MAQWGEARSGIDVIHGGMHSIINFEDNPEDTLQVAMTKRELALVTFALYFPWRLFPEIHTEISDLCDKFMELTDAQDFLTPDE